jgi:hypothetical protein
VIPAIVAAVGMGVLLLVALFALQQHGLFVAAARVGRMVGWRWIQLEHRMKMLRTLDQGIREFRRRHPGRFASSIAAYVAGWLLGVTEVLLFAYLLGAPMHLRQALVLEVFTSIIKALAFFIPGALGVQESGIVFVCRLAGVSEELGAAYALIRRAREALFAVIGWKFMLFEQVHLRDLFRPRAQSAPEELPT